MPKYPPTTKEIAALAPTLYGSTEDKKISLCLAESLRKVYNDEPLWRREPMEKKIYRLLKGIFRIQNGFALVRIYLSKVYPRKTNIHLFDLINKMRRKIK